MQKQNWAPGDAEITARHQPLQAGMALRSPDVREPAFHVPPPSLPSTYTYWPVIGLWNIPRESLRTGHYLANTSQRRTPGSRIWAYSNWGNKNLIPVWGIWMAYMAPNTLSISSSLNIYNNDIFLPCRMPLMIICVFVVLLAVIKEWHICIKGACVDKK